jgi:CheY-like chemotaxis protein
MNPSCKAFLPFVKTNQYHEFTSVCNYVQKYRRMGLIYGLPGAGKTQSAFQYMHEKQLTTDTGAPILYLPLGEGDKNRRAFYHRILTVIRDQAEPAQTAAVAEKETIQLLKTHGYDMIIIDECSFMEESGLETVRTLHDKTTIPIVLITISGKISKIKNLPQLNSRISYQLEYNLLSQQQIKDYIIPKIKTEPVFDFPPSEEEAIVDMLFLASGGQEHPEKGADFRNIIHLLEWSNDFILSWKREAEKTHDPTKIKQFNADVLHLAAHYTKGITVQKRKKTKRQSQLL